MKSKYNEGLVISTKNYGDLKIVKYVNCTEVYVEFLDTGYKTKTTSSGLGRKNIKDPLRPTIHGVGHIGVGKYKRSDKAYDYWESMLSRCYNENHTHYEAYGGLGIRVAPEWFNYQTFAEFFKLNYIPGYELDKDIINFPYKGYYSPATTVFIPKKINNALQSLTTARGYLKTKAGTYATYIRRGGRKEYLGTYKTEKEAKQVYNDQKVKYLRSLVEEVCSSEQGASLGHLYTFLDKLEDYYFRNNP